MGNQSMRDMFVRFWGQLSQTIERKSNKHFNLINILSLNYEKLRKDKQISLREFTQGFVNISIGVEFPEPLTIILQSF